MVESIGENVTQIHITRTPGICGGKPCIAGTRIRVQDIYVWHELGGQSAEEIASQYNLNLSQVYAALTYSFDHLEMIQLDLQAGEQTIREMMPNYPSKVQAKLNRE